MTRSAAPGWLLGRRLPGRRGGGTRAGGAVGAAGLGAGGRAGPGEGRGQVGPRAASSPFPPGPRARSAAFGTGSRAADGRPGCPDAGAGQESSSATPPSRRLGLLALLQLLHAAGPVPGGDHLESGPRWGGEQGRGARGALGLAPRFQAPLPLSSGGLLQPTPQPAPVCWTELNPMRALPSAGDSRPRELGASAHGKLSPLGLPVKGF